MEHHGKALQPNGFNDTIRGIGNARVWGSIPSSGTIFPGQLLRCQRTDGLT